MLHVGQTDRRYSFSHKSIITETTYEFSPIESGVPIKMSTRGVPVDHKAHGLPDALESRRHTNLH
jgi:hypothetical protein